LSRWPIDRPDSKFIPTFPFLCASHADVLAGARCVVTDALAEASYYRQLTITVQKRNDVFAKILHGKLRCNFFRLIIAVAVCFHLCLEGAQVVSFFRRKKLANTIQNDAPTKPCGRDNTARSTDGLTRSGEFP